MLATAKDNNLSVANVSVPPTAPVAAVPAPLVSAPALEHQHKPARQAVDLLHPVFLADLLPLLQLRLWYQHRLQSPVLQQLQRRSELRQPMVDRISTLPGRRTLGMGKEDNLLGDNVLALLIVRVGVVLVRRESVLVPGPRRRMGRRGVDLCRR